MYRNFITKVNVLVDSMPSWLGMYFGLYIVALIFLCYWVPGNDFDTMSSYIARIKLEEFGDLRRVGTLELQYLFPKFFDYLHAPLLKLGYFLTLPNLLLFLTTISLLISFYPTNISRTALYFIFISSPILVGVTSMKNDFSLGAISFISWIAIAYMKNSKWYLVVCCLLLCSLVGTKWHGFFVLVPMVIFLVYKLMYTHHPSKSSWLVLACCTPLIIWFSSFEVYISNLIDYKTPFPKPDWLAGQIEIGYESFFINIYKFIISIFLDLMNWPFYLLDKVFFHNLLFTKLNELSLGGKQIGYIIRQDATISSFGIQLLIILSINFYVLFNKKYNSEIRFASFASIFYTLLVLFFIQYSTWINRYFITSYMLGLIPVAVALKDVQYSLMVKRFLLVYLIIVSCTTILLSKDIRPINIIRNISQRDKLYFNLWSVYTSIYDFEKENIKLSDSLLFINNAQGGDVPFLYPFIKDRSAANTDIINIRYGQKYEQALDSKRFDYLMVYQGEIHNKFYEEVFRYHGNLQMTFYKLKGD